MDDFGGRLRQARERRGISLRQIAGSTKISFGALEALERNDISKLPGGVFSRAFVRSYALEVGLDPEQTVRDFLERFNQEPAPSSETPSAAMVEQDAEFETRRLVAVRTARIVGIIVGAALFAGVIFAIRHHRTKIREVSGGPATISTAPAAFADSPSPLTPVTSHAPAAGATAPAAAPFSGPPRALIVLDVHPTASCWISAAADGKTLFAGVLRPGEHQTIPFQQDAVVEVGDAGSFAYSVNGHEGIRLGTKGQVKTLKLTPATISHYVR